MLSADQWANGTSFTAVLAYPGELRATYTWSLLPRLKHYVESFSFAASRGRVTITFPSPYLRNEPTLVEIERTPGTAELEVIRVLASYEEAFKAELVHFHECVTTGRRPLTDAAAFRANLADLTAIARRLS